MKESKLMYMIRHQPQIMGDSEEFSLIKQVVDAHKAEVAEKQSEAMARFYELSCDVTLSLLCDIFTLGNLVGIVQEMNEQRRV